MDISCGFSLLLSAVVINFSIHALPTTELPVTPTESTTTTFLGQPCISSPCLNGGSCFALPLFYICVCHSDYTGLRCEILIGTTSTTPTSSTTSAGSTTQSESVFVSSAYNFTSPNYPLDYPNDLRFTWYFATQIGMQLALTFNELDTELNFDYIIVRDGSEFFTGELLLEWSGSGPSNEVKVVSSGNVMSVTFETDGSISRTGFAALIEVTSLTRDELDCGLGFNCMNGVCLPRERVCDNGRECGNNADEDSGNCPDATDSISLTPTTESEDIFVTSVHYFSSPNYPMNYPNSLFYTWYFSSLSGSRLLLTFIDIKTENSFDYITVREGNASFSGELLLRLSGDVSPNEVRILSSQNEMLVIFETDRTVQRDGFAALVVVTCLTTEELDCGEEFDCNNGVCLPRDRACNGQDECGNDADESNDYCSDDLTTEEVSTNFPEITSYTTGTTYSPTTAHELVFVDPAYYFTSPNYPRNYPKDLRYTWYISTFPGMRILMTFFEINTEYCYDFISVREGNRSFSGELLFRMSGVALPNEVKVLSLGNGLAVTLETDRSVASNGFAVVAETTSGSTDSLDCGQQFDCGNGVCLPQSRLCDGQEECGNGADESHNCTDTTSEKEPLLSQSDFIFVNRTRYFVSPNYPADYPKNLKYTWYLSTLPGLQLLLTFINISTEPYYDYISVRDGNASFNGELLLRWSGVSLSNNVRVLSPENDLVVTFESDKSVTGKGFTFLVETTSSVRNGFDCGQEFNCGNGVCLSQSRLCDGYEECGNGADENNDSCIDTIIPASPPSSQSEFVFVDRAYYFTSPNYPFDYPKNLRYTWYLSTFPDLQLLLTFLEVNTEYLYDFISVREGNESFKGEELLRWSGVGLPGKVRVLSVGNDVSLTLETDESVTSQGFTVFVVTTNSTKNGFGCGQQFNCGNGVCLPQTRLCDGQQECGNGADEHLDYCLDFTSNDMTTQFTSNDVTTQLPSNDVTTPVFDMAPIIICPTPQLFLQSNDNKAVVWVDGGCIDVEDGPLSFTCNETQNSLEAGDNYIGCSCVDTSGSVAECVFIVNVPVTAVFDMAPIINCPTPQLFLQSNDNKAVEWVDGGCFDVEDGPLSFTCNETQNSLEAGDNYIGCSCVDTSGSVAECVFIVNVPGTVVPPTVTNCPQTSIIETVTFGVTSATVSWPEPIASSNTGGFITVFRSHDPGDEFSVGETIVSYLFTDNPSNATTACTFLVIVQIGAVSNIAPNISCPTPQLFLQSNDNKAVVWVDGGCIDVEDGPLSFTCNETQNSLEVGDNYIGCSCVDTSGSVAECVFIVNVPGTVVPPTVTNCPQTSITETVTFGVTSATVSWEEPIATSNTGGFITVFRSHDPGDEFPVGETIVSYLFTDNPSNATTACTFLVIVQIGAVSNIAPIINCPTPQLFLQSNDNKAVEWVDGGCIDVEDGPLSFTCNETQNSLEAGDNYIGCSCVDTSGSVAECVFIVNVPGTEMPTISMCSNGTPTPQYTTPCLCNPGFGGNNCGTNTTLSGPISCPSNGITTLGTDVTYPEPEGVPSGYELLYTTLQSGGNGLPPGDNEVILIYGNDMENYACIFTITVM